MEACKTELELEKLWNTKYQHMSEEDGTDQYNVYSHRYSFHQDYILLEQIQGNPHCGCQQCYSEFYSVVAGVEGIDVNAIESELNNPEERYGELYEDLDDYTID